MLRSCTERLARTVFVFPAVLVILCLSLFPLVVSLYLSFARLRFVKGGFEINFVGLANYWKLLFGSQQSHFLGVLSTPSFVGWLLFGSVVAGLIILLVQYMQGSQRSLRGLFWRCLGVVLASAVVWLCVTTLSPEGRPGTLIVTWIYVCVGVSVQYLLGLGLALLCVQHLPGRRFFRVVFLLPMMITPVGVAYLFRMLTDTGKGPFSPFWRVLGLADFSWVDNPWGARIAVMIGDIWQWTPLLFIVLVAALESQPLEPLEAALVDGASRWQVFWEITLPGIMPVSTSLILIRMIEAFKIIDLPNVLTNGGPGTATESLTLHAFMTWRTLDVGGSAAIAYLLLLVVTVASIAYVHLIRSRTADWA
jgi:multiple sugar transport system permease protein